MFLLNMRVGDGVRIFTLLSPQRHKLIAISGSYISLPLGAVAALLLLLQYIEFCTLFWFSSNDHAFRRNVLGTKLHLSPM